MDCIKIGILRETKTPPDRRVAITPAVASKLLASHPNLEIVVQPSRIRCFRDEEYSAAGIPLSEDLSDCDWLIGVKEVHIPELLEGKKYLFFAHVAKRQPYNRPLLRSILDRRITLVDYEYLTDSDHRRLIAFGRWAGIVGAYNGLRGWGLRTGRYRIKPAHECHDREEMDSLLRDLDTGPVRILVTGGGRVAMGALETLGKTGIPMISPDDFLSHPADAPVISRIDPWHYACRKDGAPFVYDDFCNKPWEYRSCFNTYSRLTDLLVSAHFWDPASPRLWEMEEMDSPDFRIRLIADISCDINGSVPTTVRATTIAEPFYGWNIANKCERPAFSGEDDITVMSIDNLPGELPRDASEDFSRILMDMVIPCMLGDDPDEVVYRATITRNGSLNEPFRYLESFAAGE